MFVVEGQVTLLEFFALCGLAGMLLALPICLFMWIVEDLPMERSQREFFANQARETARTEAEVTRGRALLEQRWQEERRKQEEEERRAAEFNARWAREEAERQRVANARIAARDRDPAGHFYKWLRGDS